MTRRERSGSGSPIGSIRAVGTICHDRPYRSFSQPHWNVLAAVRQLRPELVDLVLRLAAHEERDGRSWRTSTGPSMNATTREANSIAQSSVASMIQYPTASGPLNGPQAHERIGGNRDEKGHLDDVGVP